MITHDFLERIQSGLERRGIDRCSKWAERYRVLKGERWSFKEFPWTREPHDCKSEYIVIRKAAQMGFTEVALNLTFYKIDIIHDDCLYVLPTESDASDFSSGRFDPALAECEHLQKLFSDVNNVGLKRAGNSTLYVRGSKSRSKLKTIPTGHITLDEVEEMAQENIPLAFERASGQRCPQKLLISTPIVPKKGIDVYYQNSSQSEFNFKCPGCNSYITFEFPDSLVITGDHVNDPNLANCHYICTRCKKILKHEDKWEYLSTGIYVPKFKDREMTGYTVSQLYSMRPVGTPKNIALAYLKTKADPTEEQEFFNSKLGKPHIVANSQLCEAEVDACKKPYLRRTPAKSKIITIGIDVGKHFHYEVDEWYEDKSSNEKLINERAVARLLDTNEIPLEEGEDALIKLIRSWKATGVVIDIQPEQLLAYRLAKRFPGICYMCKFVSSVAAKHIAFNDNERQINVNRTSWLDLSLKRFRKQSIKLPVDIPPAYVEHMTKLIRVYEKDSDGNPVGRYISADDTDHYAFARVYAEIALGIANKNRRHQTIGTPI